MADAVRTLPTPITLADFDVGVTLGTGSFGRVRFSTHKVSTFFPVPSCGCTVTPYRQCFTGYQIFLGY